MVAEVRRRTCGCNADDSCRVRGDVECGLCARNMRACVKSLAFSKRQLLRGPSDDSGDELQFVLHDYLRRRTWRVNRSQNERQTKIRAIRMRAFGEARVRGAAL